MKRNPDDRSDNVEKIERNIGHTIQNIEMAEELISRTSDRKLKKELSAKNERREKALDAMRHEIRDEALDREKGRDS